LEVTGSVEGLRPGKYNLTFEVKLTADAFGWKDIQVFLMAKVGKKGKYKWKKVKLEQGQNNASPDGKQLLSIDVPNDTTDMNTLHF
ncbi:Protein PHLOEM PROTEIN 2-LIKE A9, partial [Trichinella nelsoni]